MVVNITFVFYDFFNMYMEFRINTERLRIRASNETEAIDETQLNYAWYSHTVETPKVRIGTKQNMSDAVEFSGTQSEAVTIGEVKYYSNKVTVQNLKENTKYYYQVYQNGAWQDAQEYTTKSFSSFSFLYVGDPQIGACKNQTSTEKDQMNYSKDITSTGADNLAARNDGYNWNKILTEAIEDHSDVSFMVSAGDQVNYGANEREYAAYLGAEALTSLPVATTIGNHDSSSAQYSMHFNNPNTFSDADTTYTLGKTAAGTDYYYTYGSVLFIVLDTNNYNCATHENVIKKAVSENPDATWRVVMFHQDIYGSGLDHSDSDGMVLRTQLTPIMDAYDIDVVLQGHDHTYSRTYQLEGDGESHLKYDPSADMTSAEYLAQNNCYEIVSDTVDGTIVNPKGTVYLEANSATGSKFYELIATQQDYIAERSQTWTPSYSVVTVTDNSFSVTVYDAATRQVLKGSSTYTIVKETPAKQTAKASSKKSGQMTISWKKDASVTGYQVVYATDKKFTKKVVKKTVAKNATTSYTASGLKKGTYYVKVRSYKTIDGQQAYGAYSKTVKVTVK